MLGDNFTNEVLAVNWELTGFQVEITVTPGYQLTFLDLNLMLWQDWRTLGLSILRKS